MSGICKISSFKRKRSLERVPVLPIHEKYAERVQNDLEPDPFDDIIGKKSTDSIDNIAEMISF